MIAGRYDAVVLGGGPAGLAAAIELRRRAEVSVLVADARDGGRERIGESAPPDLLAVLERLGLADRFRAGGHVPCPGHASVWGGERVGYNDFILSPMGPAWRLDRRRFDGMLETAAVDAGATVLRRTRFLRADRDGLLLALPDGKEKSVQAGYVIDATGPSARFARSQGARPRVDDRLFALARITEILAGTMTWQTLLEATRDGWWYAARLPGEKVIAMFVTDRQGLRRIREEDAWDRALAGTTLVGPTLSGLEPSWDRGASRVHPVYSSILDRTEGDGWIAAGDAASSYDPIAAQGIHKAISDGIAAGRRSAAAIAGNTLEIDPDRIQTGFRDYCLNRRHLYGLERRWPDAPFWSVRRERAEAAVSGC